MESNNNNNNNNKKNIILVGIRSAGHSGGEQLDDLCSIVKTAVQKSQLDLPIEQGGYGYSVICVKNQDLGFISEIKYVRKANILISVHGTISYMSLFARDHTQQIILYPPDARHLKEYNILMWATHFTAYYLSWSELDALGNLLEMTAHNWKEEQLKLTEKSSTDPNTFDTYERDDISFEETERIKTIFHTPWVLTPVNGSFVKLINSNNGPIYQILNGHRKEVPIEMTLGHSVATLFDYELNNIPLYN
jgi:hypothetical protein